MKLTSLAVPSVLCAAAGLAGCGTVAPVQSAAADNIDHAQINAINSAARAQGVQVIWVNYPQKAKTSSSATKPGGAG